MAEVILKVCLAQKKNTDRLKGLKVILDQFNKARITDKN
jgi:hypothetical protein